LSAARRLGLGATPGHHVGRDRPWSAAEPEQGYLGRQLGAHDADGIEHGYERFEIDLPGNGRYAVATDHRRGNAPWQFPLARAGFCLFSVHHSLATKCKYRRNVRNYPSKRDITRPGLCSDESACDSVKKSEFCGSHKFPEVPTACVDQRSIHGLLKKLQPGRGIGASNIGIRED
jgi:hypothetical protein